VFAVSEVGKHDYDWCPQCTVGKGCNVYDSRPYACKGFACIWLNGACSDHDRPDKLGAMLDVEDFDLDGRVVGIMHFWYIDEKQVNKERISAIARSNREAGFIIAHHRPLSHTTYEVSVSISEKHFSAEERQFFLKNYRK
jgi:Fe-S-cluster containining protein